MKLLAKILFLFGASIGIAMAGLKPVESIIGVQARYVTSDFAGSHTTTAGSPAFGINVDGVADLIISSSQGGPIRCSGSLISDTHILTASHCIDINSDGHSDFLSATANFDLPSGNLVTTVVGADVHPLWNGNVTHGFDVAILTLNTAGASAVTNHAIPTYALNQSTDNELGVRTVKAGYGRSGFGSTGDSLPSGTKRAGLNQYDATGEQLDAIFFDYFGITPETQLVYDFDSGLFENDALGLLGLTADNGYGLDEVISAPGDSGGPTFIGNGAIIGVTSWGFGFTSFSGSPDASPDVTDSSWGEIAVDARVSFYKDFIDEYTQGKARFIPEPSTTLLLAIGLLLPSRRLSRFRGNAISP